MSGVMIAIAGAAVVGAGAGIGGAMIQGNAAKQAAAGGLSQTDLALFNAKNNLNYIKGLYQPFITAGTNALGVLQSRVYTSTERRAALGEQRLALQSKIDQLSKPTDWNTFPIQVGEKASERREMLFRQAESDRINQLQAAKSELALFDKQQGELGPVYAQEDAQNQQRLDRITNSLNQVAQLSNIPSSLADIRGELENDPVYQFRLAEGERAINRAAAAKGLFRSGKAIEELSDFSLALTGEETDKFVNRKLLSLQGAVTGLNAELGEQNQSVGQSLSLAQLGLGSVQGVGAAITGETAAATQLAGQAAQTQMTGTLQAGQANANALNSIASTAGGVATLAMLSRSKSDTVNYTNRATQQPF